MLLHSIRLKNIRSFGSGGADGRGQTIGFEPGLNRLSGRNGHGKSTVVEALGYALFGVTPEYSERFAVETYFLRRGSAEGEIEVDFSTDGRRYGLFCPVGKTSKKRMRVWSTTDQVEEAENTDEVRAFLARLFRMRDAEALAHRFSKLIGMKQGRMTWPFDAKPSEVKNHFEPLLEVAIYDDCNRQLAPVAAKLRHSLNDNRNEKTRWLTQLEALADADLLLEQARNETSLLITRTEEAKTRHTSAKAALAVMEEQARQARECEQRVTASRHAMALAEGRAKEAGLRCGEARAAAATTEDTREGHALWQEADATLRGVQVQMEERQALEQTRFAAHEVLLRSQEKARLAREKETDFAEKAAQSQREAGQKQADLTEQGTRWEAGKTPEETLAREVAQAKTALQSLGQWLRQTQATQEQLLAEQMEIGKRELELAAWNGDGLAEARAGLLDAATRREEQAAALTRLTAQRQHLTEQRAQIREGQCPFLKETCRQFDPAKVQEDLTLLQADEAQCRLDAAQWEALYTQAHNQAQALEREAAQIEERSQAQGKSSPQHRAKLARHLQTFPPPEAELFHQDRAGRFPAPAPITRPTCMEASQAILQDLQAWLPPAAETLRRMEEELRQAVESRLIQRERISSLTMEQKRLAKMGEEFAKKCADWQAQAVFAESEATAREIEAAFIARQIADFPNLEAERILAERQRERHSATRDAHIAALPLARALPALENELATAAARQTASAAALEVALAAASTISANFSPEALAASQAAEREAYAQVSALEAQVQSASLEVQRQLKRSVEAEKARSALEGASREEARFTRALELTESMRKLLPKAAPRIAQTLCNRVAAQAQKLYNRLSPTEPAQLQWIAFAREQAQYSLRLEPAERRFAMLSGGEQTKLALAMVLAMIQELTTLRFCIFDEPTYGIDADSRNLIADAIIEAQDYCQMEQIILVSHDEAFAGRVENEILLVKTARGGSAVA